MICTRSINSMNQHIYHFSYYPIQWPEIFHVALKVDWLPRYQCKEFRQLGLFAKFFWNHILDLLVIITYLSLFSHVRNSFKKREIFLMREVWKIKSIFIAVNFSLRWLGYALHLLFSLNCHWFNVTSGQAYTRTSLYCLKLHIWIQCFLKWEKGSDANWTALVQRTCKSLCK